MELTKIPAGVSGECDISANVGMKLHAQVNDKITRFMAEAAPHFAE
jgi:hypothetical protein